MTFLLLMSCLCNSLCYAEETQSISEKSTEELLDEVLNHPGLQAPSFYSSFELYINIFEPAIPSLTELLAREDLFVKAVYKYEALREKCEISSDMSYTDAEQLDFLDHLIGYISCESGRIKGETVEPAVVYTCKNNPVSAVKRTGTFEADELQEMKTDISHYPTLVMLNAATISYNCHSYAWYSQNVDTNDYWISDPGSFLTDGTYVQLGGWETGDRIVYFRNGIAEHSGIITAVNGNTLYDITVTSKWGKNVLCEHRGDDCPYVEGTGVTYKVYRLCTHSENSYTRTTSSVYMHDANCPTCGYLKSEEHTLNHIGICTICGGKGTSLEFNSINGGEEQ